MKRGRCLRVLQSLISLFFVKNVINRGLGKKWKNLAIENEPNEEANSELEIETPQSENGVIQINREFEINLDLHLWVVQ